MKQLIPTLVVGAAATAAHAGGVERALTPFDVMFQEGNYVQFTFGLAWPDVSGTASDAFFGFDSGNMTGDYSTVGLALKTQPTPDLSFSLFFDQPFGADVDYPDGTGYYAQGATAGLDTNALSAVVKYRFPNNVSVYGGIRFQAMSAEADLPYVGLGIPGVGPVGYTAEGERDEAFGYLVGVAYERPDIALRVGLTYMSEIEHQLDVTENSPIFALLYPMTEIVDTTEIVTPQSLALDFQTGIAENTLLFGSIRWVDWTEFVINPTGYSELPYGPLVDFADDRWTYALGLGRQLTENWAVAGTFAYEPSTGSVAGNLGPTDGYTSVGLGVTYTMDAFRVTGALRYVWLGDAETPQGSQFEDNTAVGAGIQIGYRF